MSTYIKRELESKLREYCNFFSVVGLTGPRQSGKSTLLLHCLKDYRYITFDDYHNVNLFYDDPEKFMRIYSDKVIFDEAQKVPELFNYIKIIVDNNRDHAGKFILTGSSQFSFVKGITESLAGRIGLLTLLPYQFSEVPVALQDESCFKGAYPELVQKKYQLSDDWYSSYLETYLVKDVSTLAYVGDKREFRRLIQLLAVNTSQLLNYSSYAKDLGVDVKTIKKWISILEASYIIFLLPPFYNNFGKRIVKSPKIYFYDTGLVSYLVGIKTREQYENGPMYGAIFENYIVSEIVKKNVHQKTNANLYFLRTSNGEEIDLIVDYGQHAQFIEIKATETFKAVMVRAIESYVNRQNRGYLLYNGISREYLPNISIINYKDFL